ncbi:MarR family transcriptional regulator [Rhizobium sp. RU36D]|uniref:MarR family winged helix-turn-helix transcriptional regulator n=1 Tax=Rhizobium sp. RU36D TaxID=1907415 RepID=UPI0009D8F46E|nr:MarR family transcriptional regulator [Rhizobium sp. RU36D]SMC86106.1 transcriptional regulator, MarR family [Rhizobium sp. RU36D]
MDFSVRNVDQVDVGALAGSLGFLLRLGQLKAFDDFYSENGPRGLKPGEFSVLWVISCNPGIRQSALGQRLMIKRAHMTKLIRGFEDQGLVSRAIPDSDRRAVELTLTATGREAVKAVAETFFTYEETTGAPLSKPELRQLIALLQKYVGLEETGP